MNWDSLVSKPTTGAKVNEDKKTVIFECHKNVAISKSPYEGVIH